MSWSQLTAIYQEARQAAEDERSVPLVDCPVCGEVLDVRDEIYNCPLGHFRTRKPTRAQ
jgi:C4-type Zn-finger protein